VRVVNRDGSGVLVPPLNLTATLDGVRITLTWEDYPFWSARVTLADSCANGVVSWTAHPANAHAYATHDSATKNQTSVGGEPREHGEARALHASPAPRTYAAADGARQRGLHQAVRRRPTRSRRPRAQRTNARIRTKNVTASINELDSIVRCLQSFEPDRGSKITSRDAQPRAFVVLRS
jgi:hypothetical protein